MKRFSFATVSLLLVALSCSKIEQGTVVSPLETSSVIEVSTLPVSEKSDPYFVDMADVDKYVDFRILESLSKSKTLELKSVEPIRSESGEISMYVVKYNDGWDVISSDKRSPMVLASAESGEFEYSEAGPHRFYFGMVADDIRNFVAYEDKQLTLTKSLSEESNENVEFWDAITASENFIQPYLVPPPDSLEIIPLGHWELIDVESERETLEIIDHLIPFEWGQESPYNQFSPYTTNAIFPVRAPAGCVAVAGAQVLSYLQNLFDMEIEVPSIVQVNGNTSSHTIQFSGWTTSLWDEIMLNNTTSSAKLIAYVGDLVEMQYYDNVSLALTSNLKPNVFEHLGISCSYGAYYYEIVKLNLLNHLPIIVSADPEPDVSGHTFIIDGFNSFRTKYTYTYEWVYDGPFNKPLPTYPEKIEVQYSTPYVENIKINWGYENEYYNNDSWYTLTGSWDYVADDETISYNYDRKMIYGFSKIM